MPVSLPVQIDRASPVPLYHQLAEQLSAAIDTGTLGPGDPFENELALAERLGLSRPTVRRAIAELVTQGMLVRRRGIGTTVAKQMVHRRAELTSLYEDLARDGRQPRTEVLSLVTDAQDERAAAAFGLPPHTPLVAMVRVRYAGDTPLAVLRNWLPPSSPTSRGSSCRPTASTPCCGPAAYGRRWRDRRSALATRVWRTGDSCACARPSRC